MEPESLLKRLKEYEKSGCYPYHMPGHKRQPVGELPLELAGIDVTEIEGFDDLHDPRGILLTLQRRAARLYGAQESFYLVGGSTAGILSAVSAAIPRGGRLLIARNCHRSVYHAAYLRELDLSYLQPGLRADCDICEAVAARQVEETLERDPRLDGVLIVSPTYEGRIADVAAIAEAVHRRGKILIVDEAHGAHLGFHPAFVPSSCRLGADLVIHSVHKTLPAMTQTALLHVSGDRVDRERLRRFLRIYQSSSPSYVLMASIDSALRLMEREGFERLGQFAAQWDALLERLASCRRLGIFPRKRDGEGSFPIQDIGKLVISVKNTGMSGPELEALLRMQYGLQMEMACGTYVLAMLTLSDTKEGYQRLGDALLEIDRELAERAARSGESPAEGVDLPAVLPRMVLSLGEAWDSPREWIPLERAAGRIAGEFLQVYPPGVPIAVPGEELSDEILRTVARYLELGMRVQGTAAREEKSGGEAGDCVCVIKSSRDTALGRRTAAADRAAGPERKSWERSFV